MDGHIGRLLGTLKELGQLDNTLVVFSSDHGLAIGSHGLMGKQNLYEVGMKPPLIFAGPGVPKGRSGAFAYLLDIYPTVCDLCGVPVPTGIDGVSQAPVIRGEKASVRDVIFLAYRDVQRAVRQGPWKLIRYPQVDRTQLFNLDRDPDEITDLAGDPKYADKVKEMMTLLQQQQEHYGDKQPLTVPNPKPAAVDLSFFKK
jgi:arylsulfatase A-like enzyme